MARDPKKWLLLSHAFNMDGIAASQAVTDKMPHFLERGIKPVVLSAPTGRLDTRFEHHQLLSPAPSGLRYELRHWLKIHFPGARWAQWARRLAMVLILPFYALEKLVAPWDSHWSWHFRAYRKGLELIRRGEISLIYSFGSANSAHLAAYRLARKTGLPWVAEIHDPMIHGDWQKGPFQYRRAAWIEKLISERADIAYWFTPPALARAKARNPQLGDRGRQVIPGANPPPGPKKPWRKGPHFCLTHFGSLAKNRNLRLILEAFEKLLARNPDHAKVLRLRTYGGGWDSVSKEALARFSRPELVENRGRLENDPVTGLSGRQRVLQEMEASDCLLLLHGEDAFCEEYYPSKFYEYLWTQRPILGLVWRNPELEKLLRDQGHYAANAESVDSVVAQLEALLDRWQRGELGDSGKASPLSVAAAVDVMLDWCTEALARRPPGN